MSHWNTAWGLAKKSVMIAFALIALRFAAEFLQLPGIVINIFGVSWLVFILPIYFSLQILKMGAPRPFLLLTQTALVFAVPVRFVIAISYSLAYEFQWQATRFSVVSGGVVAGPGDDPVTALQGYLLTPALNFTFGVLTTVALAAIIGGIVLLVKKKSPQTASAS